MTRPSCVLYGVTARGATDGRWGQRSAYGRRCEGLSTGRGSGRQCRMTVGTTRPDVRTVPTLVQPPAPRLRRRRRRPVLAWLGPSVTFLAFLGLWYLVSEVLLADDLRFLLPPPHEVVRESFLDSFNRNELFKALGLSATVAMVGLAI